MPFMVIYRKADGETTYEQADAIDEAALFVERLRNSEGIDQIRIYRMEEISFAFRPYYKVELGMPERQSAPRSAVTDRLPTVPDGAAPAVDDEPTSVLDARSSADSGPTEGAPLASDSPSDPSAGDVAEANGRRGLFGR